MVFLLELATECFIGCAGTRTKKGEAVLWVESNRADPLALKIADRHYNRQKPGTPQFVPPGRCYVLRQKRAVWVTSWPYREHVKHAWAGAWVNSLFRRQGGRQIASEMIRDAVAATIAYSKSGRNPKWNGIPQLGMVTFVDSKKIRGKAMEEVGRCYQEAGFKHVGFTEEEHLFVFQLLPQDMPAPELANTGESMNTSFRPSEFDKAAAASLDMLDEQAAAERVQKILHPEAVNSGGIAKVLKEAQAGLTLTPQPQTQPQAPAETMRRGIRKEDMKKYVEEGIPVPAPRKPRSDKGIPKGPKAPADTDEITVKMSIDLARAIAMACAETNRFEMAAYIQDEVISQIKKRLDALQKGK